MKQLIIILLAIMVFACKKESVDPNIKVTTHIADTTSVLHRGYAIDSSVQHTWALLRTIKNCGQQNVTEEAAGQSWNITTNIVFLSGRPMSFTPGLGGYLASVSQTDIFFGGFNYHVVRCTPNSLTLVKANGCGYRYEFSR